MANSCTSDGERLYRTHISYQMHWISPSVFGFVVFGGRHFQTTIIDLVIHGRPNAIRSDCWFTPWHILRPGSAASSLWSWGESTAPFPRQSCAAASPWPTCRGAASSRTATRLRPRVQLPRKIWQHRSAGFSNHFLIICFFVSGEGEWGSLH